MAGALLAGLLADAAGPSVAILSVAALTAGSGLLVALRDAPPIEMPAASVA